MPKRYPSEFQERVLVLVSAGRSEAQVASDLGGPRSAIYKWRDQVLVDSGLKPGLSTAQSAELVAACRRIRELEAELDILRRASLALKEVVLSKVKFQVIAELAASGHNASSITWNLPQQTQTPQCVGDAHPIEYEKVTYTRIHLA